MSSKLNHAKRSHKTFNKNYSAFTAFNRKAISRKDLKDIKKITTVEKVKGFLKKTFARKHQDK